MTKKRDTIRLSCNLPVQIIKALDKYAASLNISRTTALIYLLSHALAEHISED